jgi:hypothetical protein
MGELRLYVQWTRLAAGQKEARSTSSPSWLAPWAREYLAAEEAVEEQRQDGEAHGGIQVVALAQETQQQQDDAHDRCGNQEQHAQLNHAAAAAQEDVGKNARHGTQVGRFGVEALVCGRREAVTPQVDGSAQEHNRGGRQHACPQQVANEDLQPLLARSGWGAVPVVVWRSFHDFRKTEFIPFLCGRNGMNFISCERTE